MELITIPMYDIIEYSKYYIIIIITIIIILYYKILFKIIPKTVYTCQTQYTCGIHVRNPMLKFTMIG